MVPNSNDWAQGWQVKKQGESEPLRQTDAPGKVEIGGVGQINIDRWGVLSTGEEAELVVKPEGKANTDPSARKLCIRSSRIFNKSANTDCDDD